MFHIHNAPFKSPFLFFFVHFQYCLRKWSVKRNLATILPSKPKLSEKLQRFNVIEGSIEMLNCSPRVHREYTFWASGNGAVQNVFRDHPETCFLLCCPSIYFKMSSELRFIKVFWKKLHCEMKIFFLVFVDFKSFFQKIWY